MNLKSAILTRLEPTAEEIFLNDDKSKILRSRFLSWIPKARQRTGGKKSYAEWAHVVGIFQTLIGQVVDSSTDNRILDIGCGSGLMAIAAAPFVRNGKYVGLDVTKKNIDFCQKHYKDPNLEFKHFDVFNATYASDQAQRFQSWDVDSESFDVVTALSVWTHMDERDSIFYFQEIQRVLRKGGKAIVTFFYLDKHYEKRSPNRGGESKYHNTNLDWTFDVRLEGSEHWYTTRWTNEPEDAIAIDESGMKKLVDSSGLKVSSVYPGNWKELSGIYFQDVFVFER